MSGIETRSTQIGAQSLMSGQCTHRRTPLVDALSLIFTDIAIAWSPASIINTERSISEGFSPTSNAIGGIGKMAAKTFDVASYKDLLTEVHPTVPRTEEENERLLRIVSDLSERADLSPEEHELL